MWHHVEELDEKCKSGLHLGCTRRECKPNETIVEKKKEMFESRQSVTGYHCDVQGVTMCHRSLKRTAIRQSFTLPVLAQENCGNSQNSSRNLDGFRFGTSHSTAKRTRRTQAH